MSLPRLLLVAGLAVSMTTGCLDGGATGTADTGLERDVAIDDVAADGSGDDVVDSSDVRRDTTPIPIDASRPRDAREEVAEDTAVDEVDGGDAGPSEPECGNGIREGDEWCDDGDANRDDEPDACRTDCTPPRCGDLVIDGGETCDGAPTITCEDLGFPYGEVICSGLCQEDRTGCLEFVECGDGRAEGPELCDDGNLVDGDGCSANCIPCEDDDLEDSDDTDEGAKRLEQAVWAEDRVAQFGDIDYFVLFMFPGCGIYARVEYDTSLGELRVDALDLDLESFATSYPTDSGAWLDWFPDGFVGGTFFLTVETVQADACIDYRISWYCGPPEG